MLNWHPQTEFMYCCQPTFQMQSGRWKCKLLSVEKKNCIIVFISFYPLLHFRVIILSGTLHTKDHTFAQNLACSKAWRILCVNTTQTISALLRKFYCLHTSYQYFVFPASAQTLASIRSSCQLAAQRPQTQLRNTQRQHKCWRCSGIVNRSCEVERMSPQLHYLQRSAAGNQQKRAVLGTCKTGQQ